MEADQEQTIKSIHVPSSLDWDIHGIAHLEATSLSISIGRSPKMLLDYARSHAIECMLKEWTQLFQEPQY